MHDPLPPPDSTSDYAEKIAEEARKRAAQREEERNSRSGIGAVVSSFLQSFLPGYDIVSERYFTYIKEFITNGFPFFLSLYIYI